MQRQIFISSYIIPIHGQKVITLKPQKKKSQFSFLHFPIFQFKVIYRFLQKTKKILRNSLISQFLQFKIKIFSIFQIVKMFQSKSMNPIFENNSFIIFTTQSDFVYLFCVNMSARTNDIHFC